MPNVLTQPLIIDKPNTTLSGEWRLAPDSYPWWAAIDVRAGGFKTTPDFTLIGHPGDARMGWARGIAFHPMPGYDPGGANLQGTITGFPIGVGLVGGGGTSVVHDLDVSGAILGLACNGKRWTNANGSEQKWEPLVGLAIQRLHSHDALGGDGFHLTNTRDLHCSDLVSSTKIKLSYKCRGARILRAVCPGGNLQMAVDGPGSAWPWSVPDEPQDVLFNRCRFLRGLDDVRNPRNLWEVTGPVSLHSRNCTYANALAADGSSWLPGAGIAAGPFGPDPSLVPWVTGTGNSFHHFATPYPNNPEPGGLTLLGGAKANWGDAQWSEMNKGIGCKALVRL